MRDPRSKSGTSHPTISQTVGPFFSIGLCPRRPDNLVPESESEQAKIATIRGRVLDGDGQGVPDAILEIWRADENGEYAAHGAENAEGVPPGFARIATNDLGEFEFQTIKPGRVRTGDGEASAPHLNVVLFTRGLLRHLLTRIYFAGEAGNESDPVLTAVPRERRRTLIATEHHELSRTFKWDVHLQGDHETVFFEA